MKIEQIYTGCLAQGAYYIESKGEVAIIDPLREVEQYIKKAEADGAQIKYIFETHFHADFVSGHLTLHERTGAPIVFGPNANPSFDAVIASDGQEFAIGDITIVTLHTPGHTMESTTFLLRDETGKDVAIFSGDTLFLGDVGRPDLAQKAASMTQEQLATTLFHSLRNKIMPLSDDVIVYPGHGAGSACGKNLSKETVDTLGNQKKTNYALRADMTESEFVEEVLDGLTAPPAYFPFNVKMNKEGYADIQEVLQTSQNAMTPDQFEMAANATGALILDVRHQDKYAEGHVPNSIFIGLNGSFAPWVGELVKDVRQEILLISETEQIEEAIIRLSRVGFDNVLGYLEGGIQAWRSSGKEIDTLRRIVATDLKEKVHQNIVPVIDVRKSGEYLSEHVVDAINIPLSEINMHMDKFPDETFYIHCAGGYRSVIAASILKARGIHNMIDVVGGFKAMKEAEIPVSEWVCPTTL